MRVPFIELFTEQERAERSGEHATLKAEIDAHNREFGVGRVIGSLPCGQAGTAGSLRTMILIVSVVNVGDVMHPPVASEGHGKAVLSTCLEGIIVPTPVETI